MSAKRKVLPTVDYPQYINQEALASHPEEFEGIYARINHYVVEKSDLMDQIFNIIDTTDIRIIFKNPSYKEDNLYMYVSDSELYNIGEYVFSAHLRDTNIDEISNLNEGHKVVYIESESIVYSDSQYCFAYGGRIVFSRQYVKGLYANKIGVYRMILDYAIVGDQTAIWKFIIDDGIITDATVCLEGYYMYHTPVYHVFTGEMEIIKRPSE